MFYRYWQAKNVSNFQNLKDLENLFPLSDLQSESKSPAAASISLVPLFPYKFFYQKFHPQIKKNITFEIKILPLDLKVLKTLRSVKKMKQLYDETGIS